MIGRRFALLDSPAIETKDEATSTRPARHSPRAKVERFPGFGFPLFAFRFSPALTPEGPPTGFAELIDEGVGFEPGKNVSLVALLPSRCFPRTVPLKVR